MKLKGGSGIVEKNRSRRGVEKNKERRNVEYLTVIVRSPSHSSSSSECVEGKT
jgi:hypothetical protein